MARQGSGWAARPVERDDRTPAGEIEQELRCTRCGQVLGPSDVHYEQTAAR
ncbi:MAG: hypothetical protein H0W01_10825 [Pseudonocardiales bacterium]|nr:hypothetical protein [Pseudonocardiales bacterium]